MNPKVITQMGWRMGEAYAAVTDRILVNLARHFKYISAGEAPTGAWDYQVRKLAELGQITRETEGIILSSLGDADDELRYLLEEAIFDSLKDVDKSLTVAAENGLLIEATVPKLAPNQMQAFRAYYRQAADRLNLVNTVMLESTEQAFQNTVAGIANKITMSQSILDTASGEVISGVSSLNQAIHDGVQEMVKNGLTGFIDRGGHRWSPEAYVEMDTRTTMANAAREAVFERAEQYGCDLYQVSYHDGARPLCYPWQGKVISRNEWTGEVEDDEGNKVHVYAQSETSYGEPAGLFGINCGHYPIPFIPGFSRIRPPKQDEQENAKEYQESQQQRALERKLREEKRDLAVLKAQGADEADIKAQRQKVRNASDDLNEFSKQTGRARRTGREGKIVDAKWGTENGEVRRFNGNYVSVDQKLHVANPPDTTGSSNIPINPSVVTFPQTPATADIVTKTLAQSGIKTVDLVPWDHVPTEREIIDLVAGADKTGGSCASTAFAYAGNRGGYQVRDFRGGDSRDFFATKANTEAIAKIKDISGIIVYDKNEINAVNKLLTHVKPGKEYWLGTGTHAAIIRMNAAGTGYEYLEMQAAANNGFYALDNSVLRYRFGCVKKRYAALPHRLMEVDKLIQSPDFQEILKYINTAAGSEKKGVGGGIK